MINREELRSKFMKSFREQASRKDKPVIQLNQANESYTRVMNDFENASERDLQIVKEFAGIE